MKNLKYLILVFALIALLPITVKADRIPVGINGYAKEGAVGSEITFTLTGVRDFDGTITYNKDELDFVTVEVYDPSASDISGPTGTVKFSSKNPGKLVFNFIPDAEKGTDSYVAVQFTFKVKAATNGKVDVVYTPNNADVLFGTKSATQSYTILGQTTNCESTETTTNSTETNTETTETASNPPVVSATADNTLLYVSWGVSGLLLVAVIVLALKKRQ